MVAKVAGGVIGIGLLGTGSVALAKPGLLGMMPHYTTLSQDHDFNKAGGGGVSESYSGKFGETYKDKLVGVVGTNSATDAKSSVEDWWKWSFEKLKVGKPQSKKFKYVEGVSDNAVTKPYAKNTTGTDDNKALNQVCKEAYKADKTKVKASPGDSETDAFDEVHVWKYCSWLGEKPNQETTSGQGA